MADGRRQTAVREARSVATQAGSPRNWEHGGASAVEFGGQRTTVAGEMESMMETSRLTKRALLRASVGAAAAGGGAAITAACGVGGGGSGSNAPESKGPVEIYFTLPASPGLEADLYTGFIQDFEARQNKIKVRYTFEPVFG